MISSYSPRHIIAALLGIAFCVLGSGCAFYAPPAPGGNAVVLSAESGDGVTKPKVTLERIDGQPIAPALAATNQILATPGPHSVSFECTLRIVGLAGPNATSHNFTRWFRGTINTTLADHVVYAIAADAPSPSVPGKITLWAKPTGSSDRFVAGTWPCSWHLDAFY